MLFPLQSCQLERAGTDLDRSLKHEVFDRAPFAKTEENRREVCEILPEERREDSCKAAKASVKIDLPTSGECLMILLISYQIGKM